MFEVSLDILERGSIFHLEADELKVLQHWAVRDKCLQVFSKQGANLKEDVDEIGSVGMFAEKGKETRPWVI